MKTIHPFGAFLLIVMFLMAGFNLQAQQTDEELAREKELEEIQVRKDMLEEQEKKMKEMEIQFTEQSRVIEERARESSRARVAHRSSGAIVEPFFVPTMYGQENHTQLTLRNSFRGGSDSSKGEFEVEKGTRYFRCMINGKVRTGQITIKVEYPGGKVFKEMTITSSAEINYSQSLSIKEGEEGKYIGSWKYTVEAEKAEGDYILQISTH